MEHHFQSDVSGVLEYATVASPNCDFVPILQQTLCGTLDYFKQSSDALDALHIVLFRAWRYKEECMINFSVSRYQRGIEADEYIRLMDLNNLFERTMSHLYELPTEESIDILQQLIPIDPSARYITYYLRITNTIADEKQYSRAIDFITDQKFNGMNENNIIGISTLIREQQQANTSLAHRVKLTGLMTWLQSNGNNTLITAKPTNSNPRKKRFMIKMLDDVR
ncbi:hypothetical protein BDA99DRAFT_241435 [Phascolomyces articulosus]|uniref:Uncharacterized protein n=1 Tax=Phascolomyces articulosus TaxID=60185 RepID=A0AAD5K8G3_9FUNG|nr:hypothetical protein BDA99DRAFT_241435 [Phascolomyces articulosus]